DEQLKWNLQLAYTDSKIFAAATNVVWSPVKNLTIRPEVSYTNFDSVNRDQWAGVMRFERKF
uniref:porin n=1 Tax=Rhizobium rhizogenes TaxID=359 RepID=UPI00226F5255